MCCWARKKIGLLFVSGGAGCGRIGRLPYGGGDLVPWLAGGRSCGLRLNGGRARVLRQYGGRTRGLRFNGGRARKLRQYGGWSCGQYGAGGSGGGGAAGCAVLATGATGSGFMAAGAADSGSGIGGVVARGGGAGGRVRQGVSGGRGFAYGSGGGGSRGVSFSRGVPCVDGAAGWQWRPGSGNGWAGKWISSRGRWSCCGLGPSSSGRFGCRRGGAWWRSIGRRGVGG
uniref:Uncharacterized protein n=1 Tax=Pyxicephalus adspersus TaxID=30357 RepID=A0AAV3AAK5_PYXAD|nr:TPA: hypothetical protein GDO54_012322 [Pyxicephalus adspersus]